MPVVLLTNKYSEEPLKVVKEEVPPGFVLASLDKLSKKDLIEKIKHADYLLVSGRLHIDREVINNGFKLKMIQRTGVGVDTIDIKTIKEKNIPLYINHGVNSESVAEHTLLLILSVLRKLPLIDTSVKNGHWLKNEHGIQINKLKDKVVGLIGLGNIGYEVAKKLQVFNVHTIYNKRTRLNYHEEKNLNIIYSPLHEMLKKVDILSLHCPLNSDTENLIGNKEISLMKPGSIIINTSRGRLINENALINNLKTGHIKGAGLDVFSEEPLPQNSPLLNLKNVVLTPHIGGLTLEIFREMIRKAFKNISFFEEGKIDTIEHKRVQI